MACDSKDPTNIELEKIKAEKYKAKMDLIKTGVIGGIVTIIVAIAGGYFSIRESLQKAIHEVNLKKIEAHNAQITHFTDYALGEDLDQKLRLTDYLSTLVPSDSQRERWKNYHKLILERMVPITGFSGMANINGNIFLAVHDGKGFETGNRISVIQTTRDKNVEIWPVQVSDWKHKDGRSNDLEAVCKIPNRSGEFLLVESGHWNGKFGRMFHIRIDLSKKPYHATVLGVFDLPEFDAKGPNDREGDEIEGAACADMGEDRILVVLGERGGSSVYPSGLLRWVMADLASHTLSWSVLGKSGKIIEAPGSWKNASKNRDIAALHLDSDNVLWASATEDLSDSGTFYSVIFKVGLINAMSSDPLQLSSPFSVSRTINGFKTEALADPSSEIPDSVFSIGTEDEVYGGVWRPIK